MTIKRKNRVCPAEKAGEFDTRLRRLFQNPAKILGPYIKEDMTVLDLGCGPGFFAVEMARLMNNTGKVIAADLQDEMLAILQRKIIGSELESVIELHKCETESTGVKEHVDFILAFYVVHEIPDHEKLFREIKSILNTGGRILIVEPSTHVSGKDFRLMISRAENAGLRVTGRPGYFLSRAVLLQ